MGEIIIFIIVFILFLLLSIYFSLGKGESLIAGFNTMPKEEQDKYDTVAMCKFMGKMMFIYTFSLGIWFIGDLFEKSLIFHIGTVIFALTTIYLLVYMNTGERFKREE